MVSILWILPSELLRIPFPGLIFYIYLLSEWSLFDLEQTLTAICSVASIAIVIIISSTSVSLEEQFIRLLLTTETGVGTFLLVRVRFYP
jgi:hypothetical protein